MCAATVRPIRLHQTAVIHRRKKDHVRTRFDILLAELIEVQIETDRKANGSKIALHDLRGAPAENAAVRRLFDHRVVLAIHPDQFALTIEELSRVTPSTIKHL